jgi:phosphohistidine phosphatase
MARWLLERLPEQYEVIASPARRTRQTADALGVDYRVEPGLAPGADAARYLAAIQWPHGSAKSRGTVVVVGHQPTLGRVASLLLAGDEMNWSVKKGAIWWLSTRERGDDGEVVLRTVLAPESI